MAIQWKQVKQHIIVIIHIVLDYLLELCLGWYLGPRKVCTAPDSVQEELIVCKSAVELANLIRERRLKSYDVVNAYYNRLLNINCELNAVVDGPFEEALNEAKIIDKKIANKEITEEEFKRLPFLGVPFTTKDSTSVAGKLHTLGLTSRKEERAKADAECVALMKASGAIILATTNVPEVNKWLETRNILIGQTNNPYDLRRSAGGSSGGEAAVIAACCTAFGLGTDIGGSIRIPAFNCGIFGHKPSKNVVNTRGCTFRRGDEKETMVSVGPMSRSAKDLKAIMNVIVDPAYAKDLKLNEHVDLKKLRYFYMPTNNMTQCNSIKMSTEAVMIKVRNHFEVLKHSKPVELANLPGTELSGKMWRYWMTQEPADFNLLLGNGRALNPYLELFKKLLGRSEFTLAAIYSLIDSVLPKENEQLIKEATSKCKKALQDLLGDDGVLFYHSSPRTAPFHYYPLIKFSDFHYFSIFNVLQVPVTQVPMGLDENGMPLGIQVVASNMNDRLCLAVAEELETAFEGWQPPFPKKLIFDP